MQVRDWSVRMGSPLQRIRHIFIELQRTHERPLRLTEALERCRPLILTEHLDACEVDALGERGEGHSAFLATDTSNGIQ